MDRSSPAASATPTDPSAPDLAEPGPADPDASKEPVGAPEEGLLPPMLEINPSTRVLWRSPTSLQLELGTRHVVLDGIRPEEVHLLLGRSGQEQPHSDDPRVVLRLSQARRLLGSAGLTVPHSSIDSPPPRPRLAGELAALRLRHGGGAEDVVKRRAERVVVIDGPSHVAAGLGAVLAGAGVGHVHVSGEGRARLTQCGPGGVGPADEGRSYDEAAADALHRLAPEARVDAPSTTTRIDLRVLAGESLIDPDLSTMLHRLRQPHLAVWSGGDRGVVGPLVIPGRATCLRCTDLHRLDRDRGWSALAAQLSLTPPRAQPHNVALATVMIGVAGLQILAYLDGEACTTVGATVELLPPDWRLRRRTWPPHPECDCGAFNAQAGPAGADDDRL